MRDEATITMTFQEYAQDTFQAFVKLPGGRTLTLLLASTDTIGHVKEMVQVETGVPRASIYLTCGRYLMQDTRCLGDYNIGSASNVTAHLRMRGGSGDEWTTEELNSRLDELTHRVDEITEVSVSDNYVDMRDQELHARIDELTESMTSWPMEPHQHRLTFVRSSTTISSSSKSA